MSFLDNLFGTRAPLESTTLQEADRAGFEHARERVLDELETAVVDRSGKRLKERDVRTAMKTVMRL